MSHLLEGSLLASKPAAQPSVPAAVSVAVGAMPGASSAVVPRLIAVTGRILQELETHLAKLLSLNPSRREAVAQYLDRLAGHAPGPTSVGGNTDPAGGLRRWVQGPRTQAQNAALKTYFEEIALISLGQAIVLKSWSDQGIRPWSLADLGRLNWVLCTALKPHVPVDREGWQITRPNLYSWYNPSSSIQEEIWQTLEGFNLANEGLGLLVSLMGPARQANPQTSEPLGYDSRFFQAIWSRLPAFGMNPDGETGPLRRNRTVFSPTLRNGAMVRTGPRSASWIGTESSPYPLLVVELYQLWRGPSAPPLWTVGNGLECHTRDQLSLGLNSPKPSLISRVAEMEACDLAFVLEERAVRVQGRSADSTAFRQQLEALPYFKKLRSQATTLGGLQTCVALSKLRPGGLLFWAREEPVTSQEGENLLSFLLDRGKLLCEWDFSQLAHSLPSSIPLFPKYLYLISREPNLEERMMHRPLRISLRGQVRSHVEIPLMLEDALSAYHGNAQSRGHWEISSRKSPSAQKEWAERWPDPASQETLKALDELRANSLPLVTHATIRSASAGPSGKDQLLQIHPTLHGFWIQPEFSASEGRRLLVRELPKEGQPLSGGGFLVLLAQPDWVGPLRHFMQSTTVHSWLECNAERRGDRWILDEQVIKWIPVPKALLRQLGSQASGVYAPEGRTSFRPEWQKLILEAPEQPEKVQAALPQIPATREGAELRAAILVSASRALDLASNEKQNVLSVVSTDGKIRWEKLLSALPKTEMVPISLHPRVQIGGNLSPHLPILKIDRVKTPSAGILLTAEFGMFLRLSTDSPMVLDMILSQLEGLAHPTWNEILGFVRLPRRLELAESTAHDVLLAHGSQSARIRELRDLISACKIF